MSDRIATSYSRPPEDCDWFVVWEQEDEDGTRATYDEVFRTRREAEFFVSDLQVGARQLSGYFRLVDILPVVREREPDGSVPSITQDADRRCSACGGTGWQEIREGLAGREPCPECASDRGANGYSGDDLPLQEGTTEPQNLSPSGTEWVVVWEQEILEGARRTFDTTFQTRLEADHYIIELQESARERDTHFRLVELRPMARERLNVLEEIGYKFSAPVSFSEEQLQQAPDIQEGAEIQCKGCTTLCIVRNSGDGDMQYTRCGKCGKTYLVGVRRKDVRGLTPTTDEEAET